MTPEAVRAKRKKLGAKFQKLEQKKINLRLKLRTLQIQCTHPDKRETNWCGRDPDGAECPDCGKVW